MVWSSCAAQARTNSTLEGLPAAEGSSPQQPTMAFTYVPVPVYNLGGMGMQMMPGKTLQ